MELRSLTVAVGEEYARLLEITLVRNQRHFRETLVITTPRDEHVKRIARAVPSVRIYETDDFTAHGAYFNKGLCIERGFDVLGKHGWLVIWDCDCLMGDRFPLEALKPGYLHGCRRRQVDDPSQWNPAMAWGRYPIVRDGGPIGFFQCFQAEDPVLAGKCPWYDVSFAHAGGGDAFFVSHWPAFRRTIVPLDILHFGKPNQHWFGTSPAAKRTMDSYVFKYQWTRAALGRDRAAAAQVGEIVERVSVPGYPPSNFELPFVARAKQAQRGRP